MRGQSPNNFLDPLVKLALDSSNNSLVLVRGSPLSGKTTFLDLLKQSSETEVFRFSVLNKIDENHFFSLLAQSLTGKDAQISPESRQLCLKLLGQISGLLVIDDLDLAASPNLIIRAILENTNHLKVVATVSTFENLDELLLLKTVNIGIPSLKLENVMDQCNELNSPEIDVDSVSQNILDVTKGHPFLVRLAISQLRIGNYSAITSGRPIDARSLISNVIRIIREKLTDDDFQNIRIASLLSYDPNIETVFFNEQFDRKTVELLSELNLISLQSTQIGINSVAKEVLRTDQIDQENTNKLINWIESRFNNVESRAEIALILKKANRVNDLLNHLERVIPEFEQASEYHLIVDLTEGVEIKGLDAFMKRQKALASLDESRKSADELAYRLRGESETEEKIKIIPLLANRLCRVGKPSEAATILESYLSETDLNSSFSFHVGLSEAYIYLDLDKAAISLKQARNIANANPQNNLEALARLPHIEAFYYQRRNEYEKATEHYKKAEQLSLESNNIFRAFYDRYSYHLAFYNLGYVQKSIAEVVKIREEAKKYGLYSVVDGTSKCIANHHNRSGNPTKAREFFPYTFDQIKNKEALKYSDIEYLFAAANTVFQEFDYENYDSILTRMIRHHEQTGNQSFWRNWAEQRKDLLQQYLSRGSRIEDVLEKYMNDPATSEFDQLNLMVFALELNFRFFFYAPKLHRIFETKMKHEVFSHDIDYKVQYLFLYGVHVLKDREFAKAEKLLQQAYENAKSFEFFYWEVRALTFLSLFDVKRGETRSALSKLNRAISLMDKTDHYDEYHLTRILHALVSESDLGEAPSHNSPYSYAYHIADQSREDAIYSPTQDETRFFDLFFEMAKAKTKGSRIQIYDSSGSRLVNSDQLASLKSQPYDLIVNEIDALLLIGLPSSRKEESIGKHTVVTEMLRLLITSPNIEFTKDELVAHIWKEDYNPLVHDSRVYTTIKRVRELLKPLLKKDPIHTAGGKYRLHPQIRACTLAYVDESSDLNDRQQWILKYVANNGFVVRKTIEKYLKISPTLCKNELRHLVNRGLIITTGKGKSIRYLAKA